MKIYKKESRAYQKARLLNCQQISFDNKVFSMLAICCQNAFCCHVVSFLVVNENSANLEFACVCSFFDGNRNCNSTAYHWVVTCSGCQELGITNHH